MAFRAPPQSTEERAILTEQLIREGGTDVSRWSRLDNLATQWDLRASMAGEWIAPGSFVLDIGAGAMALEAALPAGCAYQPADVVERRPGCFVTDLNRGEFPPGRYDFVTLLGVLEYVHDVESVMRRAHEAAPRMIVTYCANAGAPPSVRRGMGWVNDLTERDFLGAIGHAGWRVERSREVKCGPGNIQFMFECTRAA